ncbi:MAG TPA: peptide chain release factor N(5)-glutamine methyltransferase [Gammaproteobacteria bacterium]|nr:peptide chain release factor N(5)-glutamine methyltransferase [Gammaproteobacteria bacterium]
MVNHSIKLLLDSAIQQLTISDSARLDAEILLSHVLNKPRSFLYACPEYEASIPQQREFSGLLQRRVNGEPVAYLTGKREFWSLPLSVSPDTLIPRPETELLVSAALELEPLFAAKPLRAIDLGTGSGCIALALAHERPGWEITAVDSSPAALKVARSNAEALRIRSIHWLHSDWFSTVDTDSFDLIVSNPPYIAATDPHLQQGDVRFEPRNALIGGDGGLEAIAEIAGQCRARMRMHSRLLLEIGHDQAESLRKLLTGLGYADIEFRRDLNGIARVCIARLSEQ